MVASHRGANGVARIAGVDGRRFILNTAVAKDGGLTSRRELKEMKGKKDFGFMRRATFALHLCKLRNLAHVMNSAARHIKLQLNSQLKSALRTLKWEEGREGL